MCGSCANETAYKAVFMWKKALERGDKAFTQEELDSCMKCQAPGTPNMSILSFEKAFHGRLFGSLTTTRSKPIHKIDIPAFDWPAAPFPSIKYPLNEHKEENAKEVKRCLEITEHLIKTHKNPVAGIIVEPIQGEGGDNWAPPEFFQGLRKITTENNVAFIVDEVQTGVGLTGKFWAHEHWGLEPGNEPDIVTFSKRMQAAGSFHKAKFRAPQPYRNFNTWLGEPVKAMYLRDILKEIENKKLVDNVNVTGKYLKDQLQAFSQGKYSSKVKNVRGEGLFLAFDLPSAELRDNLVDGLRREGIESGGSGVAALRFRPQLIFTPKHADIVLDKLDKVLKAL